MIAVTAIALLSTACSSGLETLQARHRVIKPAPTVVITRTHTSTALGVDVWWVKKKPFATVTAERHEARVLVRYGTQVLHADAVAVSFPIFVDGYNSTHVFRTPATPTVADLQILLANAKSAGMSVVLRPLLVVVARHYAWRGYVNPARRDAFFHSYYKAIEPYLSLAQSKKEKSFVYASEFFDMAHKNRTSWSYLLNLMSRNYHGNLVYDAVGPQYIKHTGVVPGDTDATDAYFPVNANASASVPQLLRGWQKTLSHVSRTVLRKTVFYEVGLDASQDGYRHPEYVNSARANLRYLYMQQRWFTMVCDVVRKDRIAGVYFWNLYFNTNPYYAKGKSPSLSPTVWVNRPGARAIAECYSRF